MRGEPGSVPESGEPPKVLRDEELDLEVVWVRFLMRVLRFSVRMLLRRRSCVSGPLLLLGLGLCLYQTLMLAWNRVRSGQRGRSREPVQRGALDEDTWRVLSYLEAAQVNHHGSSWFQKTCLDDGL